MILVILFVAAAAWVGISVYDSANGDDVNPSAQQYLTPVEPTFDKETIDAVGERIDSLQVKPKIFIDLENTTASSQTDTTNSSN